MNDLTPKSVRDLESFAGIASDWFWETDAEHRFRYFSKRIEEVVRIESSELLGKKRNVVSDENLNDPKWIAHMDDLKAHKPFRGFEYRLHRADGSELWVRVAGEPQFAADGSFAGYCGVGRDVTLERDSRRRLESSNANLAERNRELHEARAALECAVFEDPLTRLANRRAFERDLDTVLAKKGQQVALLHLDLDRFKWVNDTLGHPAGDRVLKIAGTRIQLATGNHGTVYRVGGDEFTIILTEDVNLDRIDQTGEAIMAAMALPINFGQQRATVGTSIGVAIAVSDEIDAQRLVCCADAALYEAKRSGRNTLCYSTEALQQRIENHRSLGADIPSALERGEFVPFFQPQFDVGKGLVIGVEALVRWQHPQRGLLEPSAFLPVAAERGLMDRIDKQVLELSIAVVERLARQGIALPGLSVNLSEARLADPLLAQDVEMLWTDRRCQLTVELLETIDIDESQDGDQFSLNLQQLRQMGVGIDIDDFGCGRASLTGLLKILPDRLKIDRALIQKVVSSPQQRTLVRAIVEMTQALGITCIAEGVKADEDMVVLQELGCHLFQGNALGMPMNETDLIRFLSVHQLAPQCVAPQQDEDSDGFSRSA